MTTREKPTHSLLHSDIMIWFFACAVSCTVHHVREESVCLNLLSVMQVISEEGVSFKVSLFDSLLFSSSSLYSSYLSLSLSHVIQWWVSVICALLFICWLLSEPTSWSLRWFSSHGDGIRKKYSYVVSPEHSTHVFRTGFQCNVITVQQASDLHLEVRTWCSRERTYSCIVVLIIVNSWMKNTTRPWL